MTNYMNIIQFDDTNSNGYSITIFLSGCNHKCEGCHNPSTWNSNMGKEFNDNVQSQILQHLKDNIKFYDSVVFSGGDPLHTNNINTVIAFGSVIKKLYPHLKIWIYTGYTFNEIKNNNKLLSIVDYIKCGVYNKELITHDNIQYNIRLATSNQNIYKKGIDY